MGCYDEKSMRSLLDSKAVQTAQEAVSG